MKIIFTGVLIQANEVQIEEGSDWNMAVSHSIGKWVFILHPISIDVLTVCK
jgi:hypothetical protein